MILGWPSVISVIIVLILRSQFLGSPLTIAIVGLTMFFAAPLAVAVASAWWSRSLTLRLAAAATTAAFLVTTSPVNAVVGCQAETTADSLTIYTANIYFQAGRPFEIATSILAENPDVVVMQEVDWRFLAALEGDTRLDDYRYRTSILDDGNWGTVIWSRLPFVDFSLEQFEVANLAKATVSGPTGDFTVTGVHTLAPIRPSYVPTWARQFEQLATIDTSTPGVIAGDFNATSDHRQFRNLLESGWTDVHEEKGCGMGTTWPAGRGIPFPVMRLDHVLVTDHFEVLDVRFADPAGSDHRPVVTSIRLR